MTTTRPLPLALALTLSLTAHAGRQPKQDPGDVEAQRFQAMAEREVLPILLDLIVGDGMAQLTLKQRPSNAYPFARAGLPYQTKKGYQALEQRMVKLVVENTGKDPREALQQRACRLRARAQDPSLDDEGAADGCKHKQDLGWWLKDAESPYMRSAMVLGLLEGKSVAKEQQREAMDRLLRSLGHDVERYMVDPPDDDLDMQHFRLRPLAAKQWGQTTFRLAWLVAAELPAAPKETLATLKAAQKKAPKVRCRTYAVVLVRDFDGRRYSAPYWDSSFYAGGRDTEDKVIDCKQARRKKDRALLKIIKPDWSGDDGRLLGVGPVKGAQWIVGREYGKPVRKTKAVRVYVEERT